MGILQAADLKYSKCVRFILTLCLIGICLEQVSACGRPGSMNECVRGCNCGCFKDERGGCRPCESCYLYIETGCSKACGDWWQYVYNAGNNDETYPEYTDNDDETDPEFVNKDAETDPESTNNNEETDPESTDNDEKTDPESTKARQLPTSPDSSASAVQQIKYDGLKTFIMVITWVILKEF